MMLTLVLREFDIAGFENYPRDLYSNRVFGTERLLIREKFSFQIEKIHIR